MTLHLQVEGPPGDTPNLVKNPSGRLGAWFYVTPVDDTAVTFTQFGLLFYTLADQVAYFETEFMPLAAGRYVAARFLHVTSNKGGVGFELRFDFYDAAKELVSSGPPFGLTNPTEFPQYVPSEQAPAGTSFVKLHVELMVSPEGEGPIPSAGDQVLFRDLMVTHSAEPIASDFEFVDYYTWVDVLGSSHAIRSSRTPMDVSSLTVTILDAELDPSQASLLRRGKAVRLWDSEHEELFTGNIRDAKVQYLGPDLDARGAVRIELEAVDAATPLANQGDDRGVATVHELAAVLEGRGTPWNLDGRGSQVSTFDQVSRIEQASVIDQVVLTRDTVLGRAWVNRFGVLNVWTSLPEGEPAATFSDLPGAAASYSAIDVSFDVEKIINEVLVVWLRFDSASGETEEIPYGPFRDQSSIDEWGAFSRTFTIHGAEEGAAEIAAYAATILAANAQPTVRCISLTMPVRNAYEERLAATLDLYSLVAIEYADRVDDTLQVEGIDHEITATSRGVKRSVTYRFGDAGSVSIPRATPSPTGTVDAPPEIGREIKLWFDDPAEVPGKWLPCNGEEFDPVTYPVLAERLGTTFTPDFTDVFPIGAGTKAVGTTGGAPTQPVPPHTHGISGQVGTGFVELGAGAINATKYSDHDGHAHGGDTGAAAGDEFDVMPPWRAVYFIIRAR